MNRIFLGLIALLALLVASCVPSHYVNGKELLPQIQAAEASASVNADEMPIGAVVNEQKHEWAKSNAQSWKALREQIEKLLRGDTTPIKDPTEHSQ